MSDDKGNSSLPPSGTVTPKGKLESLGREDLIKFVKRQTVLLQKMKTKNTELESQISELEKSKSEQQDGIKSETDSKDAHNKTLENHCQKLEEEKEALCNSLLTWEKKTKDLLEELACLKLKDETLTCTLHCLQQEQITLSENSQKLIFEKSSLQMRIEDLEEEALAWKAEKECLLAEFADIRDVRQENLHLTSKLAELNEAKQKDEAAKWNFEETQRKLKEEIDRLYQEKEQFQALLDAEKSEPIKKECEDLRKHLKTVLLNFELDKGEQLSLSEMVMVLENQLHKFQSRQDACPQLQQFERDLAEAIIHKQELQKKVSELEAELRKQAVSTKQLEKELDSEASVGEELSLQVIQNLQQELADLKMRLSELESGSDIYTTAPAVGKTSGQGWSDLPDIAEEAESDHQQQIHPEHQGCILKAPDTLEAGQVSTETLDRWTNVLETNKRDTLQGNKDVRCSLWTLEPGNEAEFIASLQAHRQHLEEKLVILGDKHETVTFELEELHAERESMKLEMESLQGQLQEWENMMGMLKEERDSLAQELEDYSSKDQSLRKELEFLLSSLNEAITERDTLQDEVFKLSQPEDSAQGDVKEMKSMIEDIIAERNRLLAELDLVLGAKAQASVTMEGLKRELQELKVEKENVEREKETLLVRIHLAEEKASTCAEDYESQLKSCSHLQQSCQDLKHQIQSCGEEVERMKSRLTEAEQQGREAKAIADDRHQYSLELERQVLELSSLLTDSKKQYSSLKEKCDEALGVVGHCQPSLTLVLEQNMSPSTICLTQGYEQLQEKLDSHASEAESLKVGHPSIGEQDLQPLRVKAEDQDLKETNTVELVDPLEGQIFTVQDSSQDIKSANSESHKLSAETEEKLPYLETDELVLSGEKEGQERSNQTQVLVLEEGSSTQFLQQLQHREDGIVTLDKEISLEDEKVKSCHYDILGQMSQERDDACQEARVAQLLMTIETLTKDKDHLEHNWRAESQKVDEVTNKWKEELSDVKQKVLDLTETKQELEEKLEKMNQLEEDYCQLKVQCTSLTATVSQKEAELISHQVQIQELKANQSSALEDVTKLKSELAQQWQTSDSLQQQISEIQQLQMQLALMASEQEACQREKENVCTQLSQLKAGQDKSKEIMQALNCKVSQSDELIENLTLNLQEVSRERDAIREQLLVAEQGVKELKLSLETIREENVKDKDSLLSQLEHLGQVNEQLQNQVRQLQEDKDNLQQSTGEGQRGKVEERKIEAIPEVEKEREEINVKLKQLVVKGKKELREKQVQLDSLSQELCTVRKEKEELESVHEMLRRQQEDCLQQLKHLQDNYKKLQANLDLALDEAEQEKQGKKIAHKDVEQLISQCNEVKGQLAVSKDEKEQLGKQIEFLLADVKNKENCSEELRTKLKVTETEMAAVRIQLEEMNKDKQRVEQKLTDSEAKIRRVEEEYKAQVAKLEATIKGLQDELIAAQQSMKQNSMMDLEMADYERTIANLHLQVAEQDRKVDELKSEIDKQEQTISLLQTQITTAEEQWRQADDRANKLKNLLVKAKKELADARQVETLQRSSDAHLRGQLENTSQLVEELKVQISELTAEKQHLQDKLRCLSESGQRSIKSLESQVETLSDDLKMSREELKAVQAEYHSYKVRAHSVLRQQKSKTCSEGSTDLDKHERERYENAIEQLKLKLQENQHQLQRCSKDGEQLQEEHERLMHRHTKLISELEERETTFRQRLEEANKEKVQALADLEEKLARIEVQKVCQVQKLKDQIAKLKDDHAESQDLLQKQFDASEMDNIRLQREIQQLQRSQKIREEAHEHCSPNEFYPIPAHPAEERQEGEGSEVVEQEPLKVVKPHHQSTTFTFEQLISMPLEDLTGEKSPIPSVDEETLKSSLAMSQKKIEHLTELLSESEAGVSRLTEQARLLKEEIRRLERNMAREKETQNMEYLKNIFLQFMCPKVGEQRQQLIPVLTTMLKLSPEERARVQAVAQGDEQVQQGGHGAVGGWGAYLHRWSGLT